MRGADSRRLIFIVASLMFPKHSTLMMELTIVALSIKIVFLIHLQSKVNHFQLWVLSAIEWRMNEMMKIVKILPSFDTFPTSRKPTVVMVITVI